MRTPTLFIIRGFAAAFAATILCGAPSLHATGSSRTPNAIPLALRPALYRALATDTGRTGQIGAQNCAALERIGLKACFAAAGQRFTGPGGAAFALRLAAFGRRGALVPVPAVRPVVVGDRAIYRHPGFDEWWRALPVGFEQGFTIARRPHGNGPLVLSLFSDRDAVRADGNLAWGALRYGGLVVTDADGRTVPSKLNSSSRRVLIAVDDAGARYPLTVDPLVWIGQKETASDGAAGDQFGWSVAVSGTNALVGAPYAAVNSLAGAGAVYAFALSNGTWAQTQRLSAMDAAGNDYFGASVALDGSTVFVGAPGKTVNTYVDEGVAYVFTLAGGTWTQRTRLVRNTDLANAQFGYDLALSGGTAVIGGYQSQHAAFVFTGSGSTWNQTGILTASDGTADDDFGVAVAVDGATALVGAPGATVNGQAAQGAAYVFTNSGTWSQSAKLTAADGAAGDSFGAAVAVSGDTVLAGSPNAAVDGNANNGAVYAFSNSGGSWSQTQKFSPTGDNAGGLFGASIALSGDSALIGAPALSGGPGAAYVFASSNGTWSQVQMLAAQDAAAGDAFGYAVALDDNDALTGAYGKTVGSNAYQGAAYYYASSDLDLAMSAPSTVNSGDRYTSQSMIANNSSDDSVALSLSIPVPTHTSYVSANASQGSCGLGGGTVTCDLGTLAGNGGSATANVTLKATGSSGDTADNTVGVSDAEPSLSASAPTSIKGSGGGGGGGGSGGGGGAAGPVGLALLGLMTLLALVRRQR